VGAGRPDDLRDGSVARAVEAYLTHGRVVVTDTPQTMIRAAVDRWFAARDAGRSPVLLAGTNDLVDRLNEAVIARLTNASELDGHRDPDDRRAHADGLRVSVGAGLQSGLAIRIDAG
jgi:hypothetical protein